MKLAVFALLVGVCGIALAVVPQSTQYGSKGIVADKAFLQKQKDILRLLMHVHQPNEHLDQVELAKSFEIQSSLDLFSNPLAIKEFVKLYQTGLLPRGEIFSVLDEVHRRQVVALFHVFYYAKDYETFYKVACWARQHMNEGMFVYAFNVAILHRPDCRGLILPPAYEVYPYYFINSEVIRKAQKMEMQHFAGFKPEAQKYNDEYMPSYEQLAHSVYNKPTEYNKFDAKKYEGKYYAQDYTKKYMGQDYAQDYAKKYESPLFTQTYKTSQEYPQKYDSPYYTQTYKPTYAQKYDSQYYKPSSYDQYKSQVNKVVYPFYPKYVQRMEPYVVDDVENEVKVVVIPSNYTGWYLNVDREQSLSYFTEDIGLNAYYYYFHTDYPFWMSGEAYGLNKDRRGELYFYTYQQLIARYYLERLSNGLGSIPMYSMQQPTEFVCTLQYENGLPFPMRPKYTDVVYDDFTLMTAERLQSIQERIINAIDLGFVFTPEGTKVPIYTEDGINILGNLIQGNPDSPNAHFYGYITTFAKLLMGYSGKPLNHYKLAPSVLEHYETAMRDPAFWSIYKKVVNYFFYYKKNLKPYKYTDLLFPGVKIQSVSVDDLVTYFDQYEHDITNAVYTDFSKPMASPRVLIKAQQMRLNHKQYNYKINILSDKVSKAVIRVFLMPKYDDKGRFIPLEENRMNAVELDKFVYDLQAGQNMIVRNSRQAYHTVQDRTSYYTLYRKVMLALETSSEFLLDQSEAHCGFPNRLLLPKGTLGGMHYHFVVMVSPYKGVSSYEHKDEFNYSCGVGSGYRYIDDLPLGYPYDRKIDVTQFFVPNMYEQDVLIYHEDNIYQKYDY